MTKRRLQLDTATVFRRLAFGFFVLREAVVWLFWIRRVRRGQGLRLVVFLFQKWATPHSVLYSLLFAAAATALLSVFVRLVLEPLVRTWHTPWSDGSAGLFHLGANEHVVASSPARCAVGRRWAPGTLVRTNLRLWFFPQAHDAEIWSQPIDALHEIHLVPGPPIAWSHIRGWPERLSVRVADDEQGNGEHQLFAIPDPDAVLAWFDGSGAPPLATAPPLTSPRSF